MQKQLEIKLVRSSIGSNQRVRDNLKVLGLKKINQISVKPDNPSIRGIIRKVEHLVQVKEV